LDTPSYVRSKRTISHFREADCIEVI